MTTIARDLYLSTAKINPAKVRLVVFVLSLAMFVLAAGAPDCSGDIIR